MDYMRLGYLKYFAIAGFLSLLPTPLWAQSAQELLGISYLTQSQNTDGSWGGSPSAIDDVTPTTATAVDALRVLSAQPANRANGIQYLATQPLSVSDYLSRRILSLTGAGADVSGDLSALLTLENGDGGWGSAQGFASDLLDTALAVRALSANVSGNVGPIDAATTYLLSAQNSDGGWGFVPGEASQVYYTAIVMQALESIPSTPARLGALVRGTQYLLAQTHGRGNWGDVVTTAIAFPAIASTTADQTRTFALNYLLGQQQADGSWGEDPFQTALALQALHTADVAASHSEQITAIDLATITNGQPVPATTVGPQQTVMVGVTLSGTAGMLEMVVVGPDGQVVATASGAGPFTIDTQSLPPGTYTVIIRIIDPATGVIIDEDQTQFTITGALSVPGGTLAVIPLSSHVGATESVTLAVSLTNGSNVPGNVTVNYDFRSPAGAVLRSGSIAVALNPGVATADLTLAAFNQAFTEAGVYAAQLQVMNGPSVLTTLTGSISIAPLVRIDPSLTVTPDHVLPDGEKRIHFNIRLEGVEGQP